MEEQFIDYGSTRLDFELVYSDRKTLGITVHPDRRVVVTAPLDTPLAVVQKKVRKRAAWITKQQRFFLGFEPRTPPRRYVSGETHLYLGRRYKLIVVEGEEEIRRSGQIIFARTPVQGKEHRSKAVEAALNAWYRERAEFHFPQIAAPYLKRFAHLGVEPTDFVICKMKRRWGSCTAGGKVILNTELIRAPKGCIEYVIVHELCHLLHPDHGRGFQALQAREFPEWAKWKGVLEGAMV